MEVEWMNYKASRCLESKLLHSFKLSFVSRAARRMCTSSQRTKKKKGSVFHRGRGSSKEPVHANDDRSYQQIWGLVIKIKRSGKTGSKEAWLACFFFFSFQAFSTFIVVSNYFHVRNIETCLTPQRSLRNTTNNTWDKNLAEGQARAQHTRSFPHSIYSDMSAAHVYWLNV